jgi:hypothetical protein
VRAWQVVKVASERADIHVLALRASSHGRVGEPAPVHPHLFRHARVRWPRSRPAGRTCIPSTSRSPGQDITMLLANSGRAASAQGDCSEITTRRRQAAERSRWTE